MRTAEPEMFSRLNEEMDKIGWSNLDIAGELRCAPSSVSYWRNGKRFPGPIYLRDLYEIGCDIIYILTGEVTKP